MKRWLGVLAAVAAAAAAAGCGGAPELSESEEYYMGRAVAANILTNWPLNDNLELRAYVSQVGYTVALASDRPETFRGYHFAVVQSREVNAFATPSGFIFVTTEAIKNMHSEDELAGVLAHEIAHINLKHPELAAQRAATKEGWFSFGGTVLGSGLGFLGARTGQNTGGMMQLASLAGKMADSVADEVVRGYGRDDELAADAAAVNYLTRDEVRYDPSGFRAFIARLPKGSGGAWTTHPELDGRLEVLDGEIQKRGVASSIDPARSKRFQDMKALLK